MGVRDGAAEQLVVTRRSCPSEWTSQVDDECVVFGDDSPEEEHTVTVEMDMPERHGHITGEQVDGRRWVQFTEAYDLTCDSFDRLVLWRGDCVLVRGVVHRLSRRV